MRRLLWLLVLAAVVGAAALLHDASLARCESAELDCTPAVAFS